MQAVHGRFRSLSCFFCQRGKTGGAEKSWRRKSSAKSGLSHTPPHPKIQRAREFGYTGPLVGHRYARMFTLQQRSRTVVPTRLAYESTASSRVGWRVLSSSAVSPASHHGGFAEETKKKKDEGEKPNAVVTQTSRFRS